MEKPQSAVEEAEAIVDAELGRQLENPEKAWPTFVAIAEVVDRLEQAERDSKDPYVIAFEALIHANYTARAEIIQEAETYICGLFTQHMQRFGVDEPTPEETSEQDSKNFQVYLAEVILKSAAHQYITLEDFKRDGFCKEHSEDRERLIGSFTD